jgi:hypothetical protein
MKVVSHNEISIIWWHVNCWGVEQIGWLGWATWVMTSKHNNHRSGLGCEWCKVGVMCDHLMYHENLNV